MKTDYRVNEEKIKKKIRRSPMGVTCVFVTLDKKWAIKLYRHRYIRDYVYENQKEAAEYGLGPIVDGKVDLTCDIEAKYGYITEIVDVCVPHKDIINEDYSLFDELDYGEEHKEYRNKVDELMDKLLECTGKDYSDDCHPGNIGIKNGKYVLIDFDTGL